MKKNLTKVIISAILCVCMLATVCIGIAAESITINHQYNSATGYSYHIEYTPNNVRGYSEGNCVHNDQENVFYYAYVSGSSTYKYLYAYSVTSSGVNTIYYDNITQGSIESNPSISFNRSYRTDIIMEEAAFTGNDRWDATYSYVWNYYNPESRMTLVSGMYS